MTREGLGQCVKECEDQRFQGIILEDTQDSLWPEDCSVPTLMFERDEIEYFASSFNMADVLDMSWSACCNGLN